MNLLTYSQQQSVSWKTISFKLQWLYIMKENNYKIGNKYAELRLSVTLQLPYDQLMTALQFRDYMKQS